jgi:cytochrome c oxidase cbb3-type subunit 2
MPSFAYLFSDNAGDDRGSALVAYLCSLGRDTTAARQESVAQWTPAATATPLAPAPSAALFARLCSGCHGPAGRGDGPLVARLGYPMPDWSVVPLRHAPADAPDLDTRLARIVKFGISGLPMAGHEYLSDAETLGLARHVRTLHTSDRSASRAAGPP